MGNGVVEFIKSVPDALYLFHAFYPARYALLHLFLLSHPLSLCEDFSESGVSQQKQTRVSALGGWGFIPERSPVCCDLT